MSGCRIPRYEFPEVRLLTRGSEFFPSRARKLSFECLGTWDDPPVYAIVARDRQAVHFGCAEAPTANPDKYTGELRWVLRSPQAE